MYKTQNVSMLKKEKKRRRKNAKFDEKNSKYDKTHNFTKLEN